MWIDHWPRESNKGNEYRRHTPVKLDINFQIAKWAWLPESDNTNTQT